MKFDKTIKFSNILTSFTIIISVTALLITWSKDLLIRETEQSDKIRSAAALALTKLDRWQLLNLSLYQELQPIFVETSELLSQEYNVIKVRDHLWKKINKQRTMVEKRVLDEKIMTSYFNLLSHFPETRKQFLDLFENLQTIEENISGSFLEASQRDVMSFKAKQDKYTSAMLGNALRTTASEHRLQFKTKTNIAIEPVRELLFDVISKSNKDILGAGRVSENH